MSELCDYAERYTCVAFDRSANGVLTMRLHTDGGSLVWGTTPHRELPDAFADVAADRENRVVLLTGTGDSFCADRDNSLSVLRSSVEGWDRIYWEGKRLVTNLLAIEVPVVAAVNGPTVHHAELPLLSDVVIASDTTVFQDRSHFASGVVPGDGVQVVWQKLLGMNRGRYFLLTGQELSAKEALDLGVISEVVSASGVEARARVLANSFAERSTLTLRYTRVTMIGHIQRAVAEELGYGLSLEGLALQAGSSAAGE